ncbi:hypothetical protein EV702DRAFT_1248398 [Suillus placidus]|uniref:Uncharacterized protein n=1 Tax=Suillus placidus TaxID=48579 RepID=A0A9P7D702_9AGAM|nr:hypothetical protein EV702DRAFT_1248398 [Suillus placidus]
MSYWYEISTRVNKRWAEGSVTDCHIIQSRCSLSCTIRCNNPRHAPHEAIYTSRTDLKSTDLKSARYDADLRLQSSQGELSARQSTVPSCEDQDMQFRFIVQDRPVVVGFGLDAWRAQCPELLESGHFMPGGHNIPPFAPSATTRAHFPPPIPHPTHLCCPMEHFLAPSTPSSSTLNASQSNIQKSTASSTILSATAGIIDTGTTLILTPSSAYLNLHLSTKNTVKEHLVCLQELEEQMFTANIRPQTSF